MTALVFVDTNIFVYRMQAGSAKAAAADEWVSRLWRERTGRTSFQVLNEYYSVVTRKLVPAMPVASAREHVRWLQAWRPATLDAGTVESAWRIQDAKAVSWWDALVVATAETLGCDFLLTEDLQHGESIGPVVVVNPFLASPSAVLGA